MTAFLQLTGMSKLYPGVRALTETDRLLCTIADLQAIGVAIIFISHRLSAVMACADRVVVLRDGRCVGARDKTSMSHAAMIRMMIGRDLSNFYKAPHAQAGDCVLDVHDLDAGSHPTGRVPFSLKCGEIVGFAGLIGAGRTEIARVLFCITCCL